MTIDNTSYPHQQLEREIPCDMSYVLSTRRFDSLAKAVLIHAKTALYTLATFLSLAYPITCVKAPVCPCLSLFRVGLIGHTSFREIVVSEAISCPSFLSLYYSRYLEELSDALSIIISNLLVRFSSFERKFLRPST